MFSIFKKKNIVSDIEWLGVDIHSHLLPGIDDGSPDIECSVDLIKSLHELGLSKFICTPHIFHELYPNTIDDISPALESTKKALKDLSINVEVLAAAEYMIDENFENKDGLIVMPGNFILVEMSYLNETPNIDQIIFDLQIRGYKVILAHPERYYFYHNAYEKLKNFKNLGVLLQLNLLSITGYYGKQVLKSATYLLDNKLYDLAGTDTHHKNHVLALYKAVQSGFLYKVIGEYPFLNKKFFMDRYID